jgi:hypothetical protein
LVGGSLKKYRGRLLSKELIKTRFQQFTSILILLFVINVGQESEDSQDIGTGNNERLFIAAKEVARDRMLYCCRLVGLLAQGKHISWVIVSLWCLI